VSTALNYIKVDCSQYDYSEYFIIHCCLPKHVMDDWKLKTTPVVRIERPNKTFVHFVCSIVFETI